MLSPPSYSWETQRICPLTSLYTRQVWNYSEARVDRIQTRSSLRNTDWTFIFVDLTADEMTNKYTILIMDLMHRLISNQMIRCDDRDPSWITPKLRTAIKRKHGGYNKYVKRGRKPDKWEYVKAGSKRDLRNDYEF